MNRRIAVPLLCAAGVTVVGLVPAVMSLRPLSQQRCVTYPLSGLQAAFAQPTPPKEPIGTNRNGIFVSRPKDGDTIYASSVIVNGAVAPGSTLTINGEEVKPNAPGFFAGVVPLTVGSNQIVIVKNGDATHSFQLNVNRPAPAPPVPADPPQIMKSSLSPEQDIGVKSGDTIEFGMRASPGGEAAVKIGDKVIPLQAAGTKSSAPKTGLDTAFGVSYGSARSMKDLYTGFYRVNATDNWQNVTPEYALLKNGTTVHEQGNGRITVLTQPFLSSTAHDNTVVRVGPNAGRTTPLPGGVRLLVDGYAGDQYRCEMAADKHLWIDKSELTGNEGPGAPPAATVRTINIENEGLHGARVTIPLNQRLPFEIKQDIVPASRLQLKLYGATADTDWITEPSTSSHAAEEATKPQGRAYPPASARANNPVSFITWQQLEDGVYQATLNLNIKQQWGFWPEYQDTNLVLHIKGAPAVAPDVTSLNGLKICVDPGHGGMESGAIGCSGIKESNINLAIGRRLASNLRKMGAQVVMTRDSDVDVSLADRVKIAVDNNCDLLISVHNNSLPDGRNPLAEHGTSSYYYHPQALAFANCARAGTIGCLGFPDFHTRWQNLALCRPSNMPAALVEVGFVVNPDEYAKLITPSGQEKAAQGIALGIRNFLKQGLNANSSTTGNGGRAKTPKKTAPLH